MEVRAKAIAVFFAIAQCFGAIAPVIYGSLIGDGSDSSKLFFGYLMGGGIMIVWSDRRAGVRRDRRGAVAGGRRDPAQRRAHGHHPRRGCRVAARHLSDRHRGSVTPTLER